MRVCIQTETERYRVLASSLPSTRDGLVEKGASKLAAKQHSRDSIARQMEAVMSGAPPPPPAPKPGACACVYVSICVCARA